MSFSHQRLLMVSHWSLSDNKSPQVSRTLLSILADLNNAVVWMVSTRPVISKSSSLCTNPLVNVTRAPITIGIIATFMFHSFFNSLAKVKVLISFFTFFQFYSVVRRDCRVHNSNCSLFLVIIISCGRLAEIWWSICMSKSTHLRVFFFSTSVSWWVSTGVWVTTRLLNTPGLFFLLADLNNVVPLFPLVPLFPSLPVPLPIPWWLYRVYQLLLVSPLVSCSIVVFLVLKPVLGTFIIIIIIIWEFFKPALVYGFPQDSEWRQVSSSLQFYHYYYFLKAVFGWR